MILTFDFDHTLVWNENGDYENSKPIQGMVALVQKLYNEGHNIKIFTARGASRYPNDEVLAKMFTLTAKQLTEFNIPYHELIIGSKPLSNCYIDDRAINPRFLDWDPIAVESQIKIFEQEELLLSFQKKKQ